MPYGSLIEKQGSLQWQRREGQNSVSCVTTLQ